MDKGNIIPVRLSGRNYMSWSFHLKNCGRTRACWLFRWDWSKTHNWKECAETTLESIHSSYMDSQAFHRLLCPYKPYSVMRIHLRKLHHQTYIWKFYLDTELAKYCQEVKSFQEYYSWFLTLWIENTMVLFNVPIESLSCG